MTLDEQRDLALTVAHHKHTRRLLAAGRLHIDVVNSTPPGRKTPEFLASWQRQHDAAKASRAAYDAEVAAIHRDYLRRVMV